MKHLIFKSFIPYIHRAHFISKQLRFVMQFRFVNYKIFISYINLVSMPSDDIDFDRVIQQVLVTEISRSRENKILSNEDLRELLDDSEADDKVRQGIFGYPTRPLYKDLSQKIQEWINTQCCPLKNLPKYNLLDESLYEEVRKDLFESLEPKVLGLKSLFPCWSEDERKYHIRELFVSLGKRGMLDLLGMRKTVGTKDMWPPPRKMLEEAFNRKHSEKSVSVLSVGARALSKHAHRDTSSTWWGVCTGSESFKNDHAQKKLSEILDNTTWLNIHGLPNDISTIEAREDKGYGMRWTCEDGEFRGFLEPPMEGGHELGWKH